jgi:hypothetical protein
MLTSTAKGVNCARPCDPCHYCGVVKCLPQLCRGRESLNRLFLAVADDGVGIFEDYGFCGARQANLDERARPIGIHSKKNGVFTVLHSAPHPGSARRRNELAISPPDNPDTRIAGLHGQLVHPLWNFRSLNSDGSRKEEETGWILPGRNRKTCHEPDHCCENYNFEFHSSPVPMADGV